MRISFLLIIILSFCNASSQALSRFEPTADISGANFGMVVDISNYDILVSSVTDGESPGKVYLFNAENEIVQTDVFYPNETLPNDEFGKSFSITSDFIAIGAPMQDTAGENTGAVYIYRKNGNNYEFLQKITAADAMPDDHFGSKVEIKDNFLYISANGDEQDSEENTNRGSISVYTLNGIEWAFSQKLEIVASAFGNFIPAIGETICIDNNYMAIQNNCWETDYTMLNGTWTLQNSFQIACFPGGDVINADLAFSDNQHFSLVAPFLSQIVDIGGINGSSSNHQTIDIQQEFGEAYYIFDGLAVSDGKLFIGEGYTQLPEKHPVLFYKKIGDQWEFQAILYGDGPDATDDYFGSSIATADGLAVFGAPGEGNGKAYFASAAALQNRNFMKNNLQVFPNPVQNVLHIKSDSKDVTRAEVYSVTGKLLLTSVADQKEIYLGNLNSGLYFVTIITADETKHSFKIIKD